MSNQACPSARCGDWQSVDALGMFFGRWDWRYSTKDIPRMCLSLVGYRKIIFWEKRPLNTKISKFCYQRIHRHMDSRIPASKVKWPNGCMVFCPLLWGFWCDLTKNFTGSLIPHPSAKCRNASRFQGNISENVFSEMSCRTHYNIGVKPVGFLPTITILEYDQYRHEIIQN